MSAIAATTTRNIMNFLAAPSRVASKMDWKRHSANILAVDIGQDRIGLAVAPHPESRQPIRTLEPVPLKHMCTKNKKRRVLSPECVENLASIVQEHQVCALVVTWPVQGEGRCGKPCGQVLHALDNLVQQSNSIVTKNRPVCLWDDRHVQCPTEDVFGRDPIFGNDPPEGKTLHLASQEQYQHHVCSSAVAAKVWQDFCRAHWPEMQSEIVDYRDEKAKSEELIQEVEEDVEDEEEEEVQLRAAYA